MDYLYFIEQSYSYLTTKPLFNQNLKKTFSHKNTVTV